MQRQQSSNKVIAGRPEPTKKPLFFPDSPKKIVSSTTFLHYKDIKNQQPNTGSKKVCKFVFIPYYICCRDLKEMIIFSLLKDQ